MNQKKVLHVGCGKWRPDALNIDFQGDDWTEIRVDINPAAKPDIVASMTDMGEVPSNSVDAVWSSHSLEHLAFHEVPLALEEFKRVLHPGGLVLLRLPDLQKAVELVLEVGLMGVAYTSPSGPVTPLDMLFGHSASIAGGQPGMQHKTGFTRQSIIEALDYFGFVKVACSRKEFDLWARAEKPT